MTRYRTAATRAALQTTERSIWNAYVARERQRRGLSARDSLLTKRGVSIPAAEAAAMNVGTIETIAGVEVLIVPGAGIGEELDGLQEASALVDRGVLPIAVQDELAQREAASARVEGVTGVRA